MSPDPPPSDSTDNGSAGDDLPAGIAVGEYLIEGPLGRGGMGSVYAARQPEIGARVAIKVLAWQLSRDPRLVRRFVDEARTVNKIRHPNIIDIFAFGRLDDGRHYFVMELLEGQTLAEVVARGPTPIIELRRLLLQICEALEAAHTEGVVHRDLKPENIWVARPKHGQPYIKVLDFGIAKLLGDGATAEATASGVALGTPHYMSPEQCLGAAVDHRTDIYAMGVILYLLFAGRLPFEGPSSAAVLSQHITATPPPPSFHRSVPPRLEALILSCLDKDPARRPRSARALGEELGALLLETAPAETLPAARLGGPATTTFSSTTGHAPGRPSRLRVGAVAVAVLAMGGLAAGALALRGARGPREPAPTRSAQAREPVLTPPVPPVDVAPAVPVAAAPRPVPEARRPVVTPPPVHATTTPTRGAHLGRAAAAGRSGTHAAPSDRGFLEENPFR